MIDKNIVLFWLDFLFLFLFIIDVLMYSFLIFSYILFVNVVISFIILCWSIWIRPIQIEIKHKHIYRSSIECVNICECGYLSLNPDVGELRGTLSISPVGGELSLKND